MQIDTIITLDNNLNYLLLDKTELDGRNIFYAVKVTENLEEPMKEYAFIEEFNINGEFYAKAVNDKELIKFLATVFTNNYLEDVESGKYREQ